MTVIAASKFVNESRSPKARRLDLGGVAILTVALTLLLYPLIQGREAGWPMWSFVCLAAFLPMMLVFVKYERRVTAGGGSPLVELHLFHDRAFVIGLFSGTCFFSGAAAFFLISTVFLQNGLGYSPKEAGLTFAVWPLIAFLGEVMRFGPGTTEARQPHHQPGRRAHDRRPHFLAVPDGGAGRAPRRARNWRRCC